MSGARKGDEAGSASRTRHSYHEAMQSPIAVYSRVWVAHTLLQLYAQPFLFPDGAILPLLLVSGALALRPSRITLGVALVLRNAARFARMPFVWDSEFWLALTDLSVLISSHWAEAASGELPHVDRWVRWQLAMCYGGACCWKLNSSFLEPTTSCAPIFALSILEHVPSVAAWLETRPALVSALTAASPVAVVAAEGLIAAALASKRHAPRGVLLALLFHTAIAVTPPPNGVPTFSCVAASRLLLCIGEGARPAAAVVRAAAAHRSALVAAAALAVALLLHPGARAQLDTALVLFAALAALNLLALTLSSAAAAAADGEHREHRTASVPRNTAATTVMGVSLGAAAAVYAFALPVLGLQEIGSCTMFSNMRVHGGSNHVLGVPTGMLQAHWATERTAAYGGGVVRVEATSSDHLNGLYPGEITSLLAPRTRALLRLSGHATRQFNPKARRVLGPRIRARMPRWAEASGAPFVRYTVPALELRRLLAEARRAAAVSNTSFSLHYTRLVGARGDEAWRARSRGVAVRLTRDDGRGNARCVCRNETAAASDARLSRAWRALGGGWRPCAPDELALLPEPPAAALKLSLFYPYAIVAAAGEELVCNY